MAGTVEIGELEPDASIFSRYVRSLPAALGEKAEACRALAVARRAHHRAKHGVDLAVTDPVHTLFLVPGGGANPGLPGNYLYGSVGSVGAVEGPWAIHVHDSLDGAALCEVASQAEALEKFQEVLASAPFQLGELEALGFRSL